MRISFGELKGRSFTFRYQKEPRPTSGLVKKAFFSFFHDYFSNIDRGDGIVFLDGFCGSGAMGLEAYSLGARQVYFIERDILLAKSLRKNCEDLGVTGLVIGEPISRGVRILRKQLVERMQRLDLIYLDPPYDATGRVEEFFQFLEENREVANREVRVVVERRVKTREKEYGASLKKFEERAYGKSLLEFYRF